MCITQNYLQMHHICLSFVYAFARGRTAANSFTHLSTDILLIPRPTEGRRLSWHGWLTHSGRLTHEVIHIWHNLSLDNYECRTVRLLRLLVRYLQRAPRKGRASIRHDVTVLPAVMSWRTKRCCYRVLWTSLSLCQKRFAYLINSE